MGEKIAFFGAGAVGGYVGGHLAKAGKDVLLIDPWPEHIDYIKEKGLHLSNPKEEYAVPVRAMHLHEMQGLFKSPVDIAFLATKSYDTEWATTLIKQYLAPDGFVVSLQNSINEERIAGIVGWGKTVGCIASGINVEATGPGHVMRTVLSDGKSRNVFRVGEVHGRITRRATELAEMLNLVDRAKVTTNLWGERWTKLVINSMNNAVSAASGLASRMMVEREGLRRLSIRLAYEAVTVGLALGYELETIHGMAPEKFLAAGGGDAEALEEIEGVMIASQKNRTESGRPSTAQDMLKGRRTEIDYLNGLVVRMGKQVGLPTPMNELLTALVKRIELGELKPDPELLPKI